METSIFRPKPVPMSLVGTLVDLEVRYQLFGAEKWAENWAKKGHFRVCSNWSFQSQIFGFSWLGHAQIVVGELHRVSTSIMRCRNPGSRDSK